MPPHPANRLARQTSPYLLQHAHNPVDWYPWGDEAFTQARRRGVPIFLSIGYSTCYWCHVMERESFEDDATAAKMNAHFVCIKVDREERPDVDDAYMTATQAMTGHGGWPMSVFLEPDSLRPFWCGTYFPPAPGRGMPSFAQVLDAMADAWGTKRDEVLAQARELAETVREHLGGVPPPAPLGVETVRSAVEDLLRAFDRTHGGFGGAPKFPQPLFLELLLAARPIAGDDATRGAIDSALRMSLDRMAIGGLFDHAGGGFHRYCVDATWTVPHFEKMLYDNAQLAGLYARASEAFGDAFYARVARRTLDFVLREMTCDQGAFLSAHDAEVEGREGDNYLWTPDALRAALPHEDAGWAARVYGLDAGPNFRDPHHPGEPARSVLRLADRPEALAAAEGTDPVAFAARLDALNARLYEARRRRPSPRTDDKVLASWNGLMIAALADAARPLGEPAYLRAAGRAAAFIESRMVESGSLMRAWRAGRAHVPGFLEDHACVARGLAALHRAGEGGGRWRVLAERLMDQAWAGFGAGDGVLFDTRADERDLFVRPRSVHDGAVPSGSAVMLHALIDLHECGAGGALARALQVLRGLSGSVAASPHGCAHAVAGLLRLLRTPGAELQAELQGAGPVTPRPRPPADFTPVEVFADTERITVREGEPAALTLVLRVAPGYHINAADPGVEGLVPLRVGVTGGSGVAAFADYPAGEPLGEAGPRVHHGQVEFPVLVEKSGQVQGRPLLTLTFQACTQTECLAPTTVELDVAIDSV